MKIEDQNLLKLLRADATTCEWCGKPFRPSDIKNVHHAVYTRGHCHLDIRPNCMVIHQFPCHGEVDNKEGRERCIKIIAEREGITADDVVAVCKFFRNVSKGTGLIDLLRKRGTEFTYRAARLIWWIIDAMPDQTPAPRPLTKKKRRPSAKAKAARKKAYEAAKTWKAAHK